MHIVHEIGSELEHIAKQLSGEGLEFDVSVTSNPSQGDISSNIALVHFKKLGFNSPREAAVKIAADFEANNDPCIEKIEIAGPGFINFFLSAHYLQGALNTFTQNNFDSRKTNTLHSQKNKVIVEFGDPNPFKEIHIGHLRNFCIGESFSRTLSATGNEVVRANYQGDVGLHVAKAMWGLLKREEQFLDSSLSEEEKVKLLAASYVEGATEFEANEDTKAEIIDINKRIYSDDESLHQLWEEGRKVSLEHFEELYKRIGIVYNKFYFESQTAKRGRDIVLSHIEDGVFEKDAGAVVYRGEKDGLHTRVFLTSKDYATYEGKDLALAIIKNEDNQYDQSIILTGNEQAEYFAVMIAALRRIYPELADKTKHLTFGHVRLKEGKMSSRTGDVITASWLMDEAVQRVKTAFPEMDDTTAEKVGVGSVKYSMLKFSIPSDIHFSFEESISLEGNSGPYLQYAYVRTQSIMQKSKDTSQKSEELQPTTYNLAQSAKLDLQPEESDLLRFLSQYGYFVEMAATTFAPNLVCNYLLELAQKFNLFYQKHKVIGSDNESFRLALTKATGNVLKDGLSLLGIETVEKM